MSDPIGDLADTVHVKSDQAEFRDYFRKWFVGILPALLDDTVVNHEILVLIGEQGLYKTTWFNFPAATRTALLFLYEDEQRPPE